MDAPRVSHLNGVVLSAASGTDLIQVGQPTDAFPRWRVTSDGAVYQGTGGSAPQRRSSRIILAATTGATAVPLAEAERTTFARTPVNLTGYSQCRLLCYAQALSGGAAGQELRAKWALNSDLATWKYLDNNTGASGVVVGNSSTGVGGRWGAWVNIAGVPDGDLVVSLFHLNGDGTGTLTLGGVILEVA